MAKSKEVLTKPGKTADDTFLEEALDRFKLSAQTFGPQRAREADDERFAAGDQWDPRARQARAGNPNNGAANEDNLGAKPCLTISLLDQPMQQTINAFDDAEISVQFSADDGEANEETADVLNDLYRQIESKSGANAVRAWAFERGAKAGMGWYRVVTEYENDEDFDQCVRLKRILNQSAVYPDPWAQEQDFSDGEFLFVTEDVPYDTFKREYKDSKIDGLDDSRFTAPGDPINGWVKIGEAGQRSVRVAEYFYIKKTKREMKQGSLTRNAFKRKLCWAKITAADVLEEQELDGKWIPFVPVVGKEYNLSGERRWTGLIAPAKDAQRSYNVMRSEHTSLIGISSKAPWIAAAGQIEEFLDEWQSSNTRNWAVLRYKPVDAAGGTVGPPQRQTAEPPIQAVTLACQMAQADVHATTGFNSPSLGAIDPQSRSGKAIVELKKQTEAGSGYLASFCSISVPCEARIVLDLIPHIYDRKSRVLNLKSNSGKRRKVTLGEPLNTPQQQPQQPMQPGMNGQPYGASQNGQGSAPIDFAKGTYGVEVTVSKAFATRRQQAAEAMSQIIQADPQLMTVIGDLYFKNSDFADHQALVERMEAVLDPRVLQAMKMATEIPPQVKAQVMQLATQLQQTQQQAQQMAQVIQTKQVEQQAKIQQAQMDNDTKIKIAEIQALVALAVAEEKVDAENARTLAESESVAFSKKLDLVNNLRELLAKHHTDQTAQAHSQAHEAGMAHMTHQHTLEQAAQAAEHARQMAAMQPQPQADGAGD